MKHLFLSALAVVSFFAARAQDVLKTRVSERQSDHAMLYAVSSSREFYMGSNKHVLHIGNNEYDIYEQQNEEGKGTLTFFIPRADWITLREGSLVYLTYGEVDLENGPSLEEVCKQHLQPCWSLGRLAKVTR